jgi:hypothetical protein
MLMPITVVTRGKSKQEDVLPLAREVAPILKRHGATSVLFGYCHSGAYTGQISVVSVFPDWTAYGRAAQALLEDAEYQRLLARALTVVDLLDRSLIVTQEL